jgi:hypothetical protein
MQEIQEKLAFSDFLEAAMLEIAAGRNLAAFKGTKNRQIMLGIICQRAGLDKEDPEVEKTFNKLF